MKKENRGQNCWFINLLPFSEGYKNDEGVEEFQLKCVEEEPKVFGMGSHEVFEEDGDDLKGSELSDAIVEKYGTTRGLKQSLNAYKKISSGDLVIMRLKNTCYYLGKVKAREGTKYPVFYLGKDGPEFSPKSGKKE